MKNLGQLFFSGISGKTLTADERVFIEKEDIGGVILFSKNYESPTQLSQLVNSIQALRNDYPLFIAVDQEGGRVIRFKEPFTLFPPMLQIASASSPRLCYQVHKIMAEELHACGINLNLAPCCDILSNTYNKVIGDRAFGSTHETVSLFISSAIRGLQNNGVMACAKHFPGHGSTLEDSHDELPIIKMSWEHLEKREIRPFIKAILSRVEFMMMGHLLVEALDTEEPCSLSQKAHDYLRNELKFKKLILSDDMQMGAITNKYSIDEAAELALKAGTDILVYRDIEKAQIAIKSIRSSIKSKSLLKSDLKEKVERIFKIKNRFLSKYKPIYIPDLKSKIGTKTSQIFLEKLIQKISEKST